MSLENKLFYHKVVKWIANTFTPSYHNYSKWERKNWWLRKTGIRIGKRVAIGQDFVFSVGCDSENICIEDYCSLGSRVSLLNFNSITIGRFSMLAEGVTLVNGGHDKNSFEPFSGPLSIGRGCWIGNGARVVGPITIGDNVVVGAGAVVVKNVPDNCIVVGVPARIVGERDLPDRVWHHEDTYFCPNTFTIYDLNMNKCKEKR